jgi:23S rRNA (uridine2552-2'-O)-methyltransferase
MAKNKFNKAWLDQHRNDPYVKLAQKHGYRARAAFKLAEILDQDALLKPGMTVVDLGSAPGAWSQVVRERLGRRPDGTMNGRIVALDLLPMEPIADVQFIQGDFRDEAVLADLTQALGGRPVDLVLSDMAPNLSGVAVSDAARMADLVEMAVAFASDHLKVDGTLLVKCFHGSGYSQLVELFKQSFVRVASRKPKASREKSAETYLLGRGVKTRAPTRPTAGKGPVET